VVDVESLLNHACFQVTQRNFYSSNKLECIGNGKSLVLIIVLF